MLGSAFWGDTGGLSTAAPGPLLGRLAARGLRVTRTAESGRTASAGLGSALQTLALLVRLSIQRNATRGALCHSAHPLSNTSHDDFWTRGR